MQNIKQKQNKKALSQIVSTMLLVLMVLISIPVFYIIINKTIREPLKSPELSCPEIQINPPIKITKTCYNQETQNNEITLGGKNEYKINLIEFILELGAENKIFKCDDSCSTCKISKENAKTYYIFTEQKPEEITIRINNCEIEKRNVGDC